MLLLFPWLSLIAVVLALSLDAWWGEFSRYHPLVIFGRWVTRVEQRCWLSESNSRYVRWRGISALLIVMSVVVIPALLIHLWLLQSLFIYLCLSVLIIYFCIGRRSLREHAEAVELPLRSGDLVIAREAVARIVSRDTAQLSEPEVASAVCESVLENGSDALFAALFWFLVAGIPGVVIYRAVNTLDAMWGYKNTRYQYFGWAAARLDDVLNWLPARLVAVSYALMGHFSKAMQCWLQQGVNWKSPNAGPVMAAGAGSLNIELGGNACYHGRMESRPTLGCGRQANCGDIAGVLALLDRTLGLWLIVIAVIALLLTV